MSFSFLGLGENTCGLTYDVSVKRTPCDIFWVSLAEELDADFSINDKAVFSFVNSNLVWELRFIKISKFEG